MNITHQTIGRYCSLNSEQEIKDLKQGYDFRLPKYRREVFHRFYTFHLKYKSHPGAVYYAIPYVIKELKLTPEDSFWLGYINGCCQNIVTTYCILKEFPSLKTTNPDQFNLWFREQYGKLGWDTDRRYVKNKFTDCIRYYKKTLNEKSQIDYFNDLTTSSNPKQNFRKVWDNVINNFEYFGRLSTFSYLEYLRIIGLNIDCDSLFLDDISGSKSHRNGLCKVLGRDDLDMHDKLNPSFKEYTPEVLKWLNDEGEILIQEAKERNPDISDVGYFTLESTLCCYKSWHRKNRRYPNVYNDMFHDRIKYAEEKWNDREKFKPFWKCRELNLPEYLRLESNPRDVGVNSIKQNHYLNTGEVIMMDKEWNCFKNKYNDEFYSSIGLWA